MIQNLNFKSSRTKTEHLWNVNLIKVETKMEQLLEGEGEGEGQRGAMAPLGFEKGPPPPYNLYENKIIC